jgi:hypothetical protein
VVTTEDEPFVETPPDTQRQHEQEADARGHS